MTDQEYNLVAYTSVDGIPTFTDSFIVRLFERVQNEGLFYALFYDGDVKTAGDFLNMFKFGKNQLFVIVIGKEIAGIVWLNNFEVRRAEFHFCFFENLRGKRSFEIGKKVVSELLNMEVNGKPIFDILTGLTPANNRAARLWCKKLGFTTLGVIPSAVYDHYQSGKSIPGIVSYVERGVYG